MNAVSKCGYFWLFSLKNMATFAKTKSKKTFCAICTWFSFVIKIWKFTRKKHWWGAHAVCGICFRRLVVYNSKIWNGTCQFPYNFWNWQALGQISSSMHVCISNILLLQIVIIIVNFHIYAIYSIWIGLLFALIHVFIGVEDYQRKGWWFMINIS